MMQYKQDFKILREAQVAMLTGLSKSTRWRLEKYGDFPKKRQLSTRSVGWLASEIEEWIQTRAIIIANDITRLGTQERSMIIDASEDRLFLSNVGEGCVAKLL